MASIGPKFSLQGNGLPLLVWRWLRRALDESAGGKLCREATLWTGGPPPGKLQPLDLVPR